MEPAPTQTMLPIKKQNKQTMKKWFKKNKTVIAGAALGALLGLLYWNFVGCSSGSCMITSKPVNSSLYGALIGGLLFSTLFEKDKKQNSDL